MNRRQLLAGGAATFLSAGPGAHAQMALSAGNKAGDMRIAARNAWLWGFPLIEMAQQRSARSAEGAQVNAFQHQRALITSKDQFVTTPNNDTLYSQAWLNLEGGPVTISVPAAGDRYFCVPLMNMYTNNFAIVGTRTSGESARTFTVVGPRQATNDASVIRSPTNWVWVLGRTLVDGEKDLPAAHAFQDGWSITGPHAAPPRTYPTRTASWDAYFGAVQELMNESPPPVTDSRILDSMSPLIGPGRTFDASRFSPDQVADIRAGVAEAAKALASRGGPSLVRNGWDFPRFSLGDFGQDYTYRAAVALGGLGALPRVEAMYLRAAGADGTGFDSAKDWRLTFGADQLPPVDAFWSLSMYRLTPERQLFFADNAMSRYTIGDRTPGLKRGPDGSLDIWMSRTNPDKEPGANWLPSPADRRFVLILRAYLPKPALLEGRYEPPPIKPA